MGHHSYSGKNSGACGFPGRLDWGQRSSEFTTNLTLVKRPLFKSFPFICSLMLHLLWVGSSCLSPFVM